MVHSNELTSSQRARQTDRQVDGQTGQTETETKTEQEKEKGKKKRMGGRKRQSKGQRKRRRQRQRQKKPLGSFVTVAYMRHSISRRMFVC